MKTLEQIFALKNISDQITALKDRVTDLPDSVEIKKQWNVLEHEIFDETERPRRYIYDKNDVLLRVEDVGRIGIAAEKLIVRRAASFLFGNEVELSAGELKDEKQKQVFQAVKSILKKNKSKTLNRRIARQCMAATEVAEYWYITNSEAKHNAYGEPTPFVVHCSVFSPLEGNDLYPLFDETGNLIAFSREYTLKDSESKEISCFETYTDKEIILWQLVNGEYTEVKREPHTIGKIPVIYGTQEETEFSDVQYIRKRLEWLLSHFADINDYHAAPKIFVTGEIDEWGKKQDAGMLLHGSAGSDIKIVSWEHAPESVRLEIDTLWQLLHTMTQTPDISFHTVKNMGNIAYDTLQLMFMDAHLKVEDKKEIFDEYLIRRMNLLKAIVKVIYPDLKAVADSVDIEPVITPYMLTSMKEKVGILVEATGGKAFISQKSAVEKSGLTDNPAGEFEQIRSEEQQAASFELQNPIA